MRIAISGGIASGKSTLLRMLEERGVPVFSADAVAQDILWSPDIQSQLMGHFSTTEPISPVVLKTLIAQSDQNRRAVNKIMHPAIAAEIDSSDAIAFEIPLLFETCLHVRFDAIWLAFCSRETQSKRLIERYGRDTGFDHFSWQLDSKVGLTFADSIIPTDGLPQESLGRLLQEAKRCRLSLVVS